MCLVLCRCLRFSLLDFSCEVLSIKMHRKGATLSNLSARFLFQRREQLSFQRRSGDRQVARYPRRLLRQNAGAVVHLLAGRAHRAAPAQGGGATGTCGGAAAGDGGAVRPQGAVRQRGPPLAGVCLAGGAHQVAALLMRCRPATAVALWTSLQPALLVPCSAIGAPGCGVTPARVFMPGCHVIQDSARTKQLSCCHLKALLVTLATATQSCKSAS